MFILCIDRGEHCNFAIFAWQNYSRNQIIIRHCFAAMKRYILVRPLWGSGRLLPLDDCGNPEPTIVEEGLLVLVSKFRRNQMNNGGRFSDPLTRPWCTMQMKTIQGLGRNQMTIEEGIVALLAFGFYSLPISSLFLVSGEKRNKQWH